MKSSHGTSTMRMLPNITRLAVEQAWQVVRDVFDKHGLKSATDDRTEALIAALYRY